MNLACWPVSWNPAQCLTPEVAQEIVKLRADSILQARVELLASNNTEGTLAEEERSEYKSKTELYIAGTGFLLLFTL